MDIEEMKESELIGFREISHELDLVFDVGARGNLEFLAIRPEAQYHLFEPIVGFADHLKQQTKSMPNVTVNQIGLSDTVQTGAVFYSNVQSFEPHPFIESNDGGERFDLNTVDEYCREKGISKIDFLKIDAEGFDYKVLVGAKQMLEQNRIKYIQFEYWAGVRKFYDLLKDQYDMQFVDPQTNERRPLDEECVEYIDTNRIPSGKGGDVFCKLKQ
jgi:FkbM family methyltransferase